MKKLFIAVAAFLCLSVIVSQIAPTVWAASNSTRRTYGMRMLTQGLVTVPNSAADLSTKNTVIFQIVLCNKTDTAATVTILDKAGTPKSLLSAASIAARTTYVVAFPEGVLMNGGVNWVAGTASAIDAEVFGFRVE